ncbi:hypothetical protein Tco_1217739, partial [Tanacetum coccineum]
RDDSHGEAFPTATSLDAGQDRENIPKTSAIPHESSPRVTSLGGVEGNLQLKLNELMNFCTKLQSQHSQMATKIQRIATKALTKGVRAQGKEVFTTASPPVPPISLFVPIVAATASEMDSTAVVITTTTAVTPYIRRTRASRGVVMASSSPIPINIPSISKEDKGKGIMTEPAKPTKQKDAEIARLHTEGELQMMIDELDRSNEVIVKHLKEYAQAEDVLSLEDKIELITELAKYQKDLGLLRVKDTYCYV